MKRALSAITPSLAALVLVACSGNSGATITGTGAPPTTPGANDAWSGDIDVRACSSSAFAGPRARCAAQASSPAVALALCGDLAADNTLTVDTRSNATGAALAVEGSSRTAAPLHVGGSFTSMGGIQADNTEDVDGTLQTGGAWSVAAPVSVGADAFVGGALTANNTVRVHGTLHVSSSAPTQNVTAGAVVAGPVSVAAPLDCANAPDIGSLIADAIAPSQTLYGAPLDALANVTVRTSVTLGCGRYRFSTIGANNELAIHVEGTAVVIVDGDFHVAAPTEIDLAPGASLDLLIGGAFAVDNTLAIGAAGSDAWVGVAGDVRIAAPTTLGGWLVAPRTIVAADNTLTIAGAAYTGGVRVAAPVVVHDGGSFAANGCILP